MLQSETTRDAAGLIHDLGNFIQIASSAVAILARNPRLRESGLESVIEGAQVSLSAASALVRQNMAVARASAVAARVAVVADCVAEIEAVIDGAWDTKFRLHTRVGEGLPKLKCDPVALQNAILNLLFNARDAMPDGGDIILAAIERKDEVEIVVADNGVGMTAETIRRAFDPFFTTKAGGMGGLGLPSVKRFVSAVGGGAAVQSEPGVGTIVMLNIPAVQD